MIRVLDYGLGNVHAFLNIYKNLGIKAGLAKNKSELSDASKIILPGVGAFDQAMTLLENSGMTSTLKKMVLEEKIPILGICVGMQMLGFGSEEGKREGLGFLPGYVREFKVNTSKENYPVPHMGWNDLNIQKEHELTKDLPRAPNFYFLHSYHFNCDNEEDCLTKTVYSYGFASIIARNNIFGIQCHPEKSHKNGITILKNFSEI